jgi:ribulose 1,5-bisphosphate synthetase/thiazole synthase
MSKVNSPKLISKIAEEAVEQGLETFEVSFVKDIVI